MDNLNLASSLLALLLMIGALAALPWLLKRWQQRQQQLQGGDGVSTKVLSAVVIGPGQRVVTVEVSQGADKVRLVLGVTTQQVQCLHVLGQPEAKKPAPESFAGAMAQVQESSRSVQL